jgi:hypothetical protein
MNIINSDFETPQGIQKHLGPGRVVPQEEWSRIRMTHNGSEGRVERWLSDFIRTPEGDPPPTVYHWASKNEDLYVAFWPPPQRIRVGPRRTAIIYHHFPGSKTSVSRMSA